MHTDVLTIGATSFRDDHRLFGIAAEERLTHLFLLGQTGTGKTTLIESMARQDIAARRGCIAIDPHGDHVKTPASHGFFKRKKWGSLYFQFRLLLLGFQFSPKKNTDLWRQFLLVIQALIAPKQ